MEPRITKLIILSALFVVATACSVFFRRKLPPEIRKSLWSQLPLTRGEIAGRVLMFNMGFFVGLSLLWAILYLFIRDRIAPKVWFHIFWDGEAFLLVVSTLITCGVLAKGFKSLFLTAHANLEGAKRQWNLWLLPPKKVFIRAFAFSVLVPVSVCAIAAVIVGLYSLLAKTGIVPKL